MRKLSTVEFIDRAITCHGNRYDYSNTVYTTRRNKVTIHCKEHGDFKQFPNDHLNGTHCRKCALMARSHTSSYTISDFIKKAVEVHDNIYDYSKVVYEHNKIKVVIICRKHGEFYQQPNNHLMGQGCPKCRTSKGEQRIIKILNAHEIVYEFQKTFNDCRRIRVLPFDFYIPHKNLIVEYDGEQHFSPFNCFNGLAGYNRIVESDNMKDKYCKDNGIEILRIGFNDFNKIEEIIINKLGEK